ncbi:putative choline dehydrogenase [Aureobasidium sp. EXF-10728]|nr:putative choline dehydrogenase [Aureobasidium sp. EXF-10728]
MVILYTGLVLVALLTQSTNAVLHNKRLLGSRFGVPGCLLGLNASYDYVVVGGGTAGLTVATRLAQNGSYSVAVIEAGSFYELDDGNFSQIPYYESESASALPDLSTVNSLIDWRFLTTPQSALSNRTMHYARGKCLGGSSSRNYMVYNRGTIGAFAKWADQVGDPRWEWDNVYPYYLKSAHYTPANTFLRAANSTRGTVDETASFKKQGGPLQVSLPNYAQPWSSFLPGGLEELGVRFLNQGINAGVLDGYASITLTIDPADETRSSSETSFLRTALADTDLVVYTHALAKRILFDADKRATGVLVDVAGMHFQVNATREIILSAGAFQSPQLLMVSGVGPRAVLKEYRIPIVAERPGVGQNMWLRDVDRTTHLWVSSGKPLSYEVNVETTSVLQNDPTRIYREIENYVERQSGLLTSKWIQKVLETYTDNSLGNGADTVGFMKLSNLSWTNMSSATKAEFRNHFPPDWPETEVISFAVGPNDGIHNIATISTGLLATFSRGTISLNSSDMADAPLIDPAFLSDKRDQDLAIAAFKFARRLAATESLQQAIIGEEVFPGPGVSTDAEILEFLRQSVHHSSMHRMGKANDSMAVVDAEAKVIGVSGLRVIDASAFALLPPGQPQATIYMMAEMIADMILEDVAERNTLTQSSHAKTRMVDLV